MTNPMTLWDKFKNSLLISSQTGIRLDISRMSFPENFLRDFTDKFSAAISEVENIESGKAVNIDENRMVGHYWLRNSSLAPEPEITTAIEESVASIATFADSIHKGEICGEKNASFKNLLLIGIGGSALGPQLVSDALGSVSDRMMLYFCDNTDPDGMERIKSMLSDELDRTLCIVISKSGGTVETRNGMIEFESAYSQQDLSFSRHAVAITCEGSALDAFSKSRSWLNQFYMWDWVGGRTSLFSAVGLLPAALQGIDIRLFLAGAQDMDIETRNRNHMKNPALLLSAMWYFATDGAGNKDMVILPYKDRLCLFSKYLQQLIMESLGKEKDRNGNLVHQGISVYGNKGSTDQHAYIQQLRDGVPNFFATFIEVLSDYTEHSNAPFTEVAEDGITSGAYLNGFFLGTREALFENGRDSVTITLEKLTPYSLGALIALFERAVSCYASYVNINAYHQPGVEAGKKAAEEVIAIRRKIKALTPVKSTAYSPEEIAALINEPDRVESVYKILEHLAVNYPDTIRRSSSPHPAEVKYLFL
jgi:glucose-6-phosphate isomerase